MIAAFLLVGAYYVHDNWWHIRYRLAKRRLHSAATSRGISNPNAIGTEKEFDAFVSYSNHDKVSVNNASIKLHFLDLHLGKVFSGILTPLPPTLCKCIYLVKDRLEDMDALLENGLISLRPSLLAESGDNDEMKICYICGHGKLVS